MDAIETFKHKFKVGYDVNRTCEYYGMDSYKLCADKSHFKSFPHKVEYKFNSMGFRDNELPSDVTELENAIWCIGDSFTVGLGSPLEHTWPYILEHKIKRKCINVSMNGASNQWISMLAVYIIKNFNPTNVVCCWSYPERRIDDIIQRQNDWIKSAYNNIKDFMWPKCESVSDFNKLPIDIRKEVLSHNLDLDVKVNENLEIIEIYITYDLLRKGETRVTNVDDLENMISCLTATEEINKKNIVHSIIPNFCNPIYKKDYEDAIQQVVKNPIYIKYLDRARDGHHFDILTSKDLVKNIIKQLDLDKQ